MIQDFCTNNDLYLDELRRRVEVGIDEIGSVLPASNPHIVIGEGGLIYLEVNISENLELTYFLEAYGEYTKENLHMLAEAMK